MNLPCDYEIMKELKLNLWEQKQTTDGEDVDRQPSQ